MTFFDAATRKTQKPTKTLLVAGPNGALYPVAAIWRKALARIIDAIAVFFLQWMLTIIQVLGFMENVSTRWQPEPWGRYTAAILVYIFFHFVYTVVFLRWNEGQTPAMDLLKLRAVCTVGGGHLSVGRCTARWFLGGASWIVPPVLLGGLLINAANYLTAPFDDRYRTMSDWVAGTTVISYNRDEQEAEDEALLPSSRAKQPSRPSRQQQPVASRR
ncbi:MAG: RDD family protein [bacterium]|nr:RDD family protein [bacterium]